MSEGLVWGIVGGVVALVLIVFFVVLGFTTKQYKLQFDKTKSKPNKFEEKLKQKNIKDKKSPDKNKKN